MKKFLELSALVSPRVALAVGLLLLISPFGTTGCGSLGLTHSLTGISILPNADSTTCTFPGGTAQYHAYGSYTEGGHSTKVEDISDQVSWSLVLPDLATINSSGLATASTNVTGTSPVLATIQGEFGNLTAQSSLQVSQTCGTAAVLVPFKLNLVPASQNLTVGKTLQPLAIASIVPGGRTTDLSRQATWLSSNTNVAAVDANGVIRAVGPGDATVTAFTRNSSGATVSATTAVHVPGAGQN
ncbi:MAG TPA: Ig-like domain-containing protein [Acidobacteriaceae bacterium]|jgi:hypothetical protein|nr:Ig-like domain-containing protein [Acidobacteriaceae bacterium]